MRQNRIWVAIAALAVVVAACGGAAAPSEAPPEPTSAAPTEAATTAVTAAPTDVATAAPSEGALPPINVADCWPPERCAQTFDLDRVTPGPNGEAATPVSEIPDVSQACVDKVKAAGYDLTFLSSFAVTWFQGVQDGVVAEAERFGFNTTIGPVSNFSPETQLSDVETVMATKPDVLIALPNDPVSAAQAFKPAVDAGTTLVLYDNGINGYTAGKEYVGIVTGDHYNMAKEAAKLTGEALGGKGKLAFVYYDVPFFNANQRDIAYRAAVAQMYPDIEIIDQGFADSNAVTDIVAALLTQHPDLDGIFTTWSGGPATGALAAVKAANNDRVKVISVDLDEANDLDMAQGGNYYGASAEETYTMGIWLVRAAAKALCGEEFPPFVVVPTAVATRDTLQETWNRVYAKDPPQAILDALSK